MPLVRIDLVRGKSIEFRKALGEIVYQAMRELINVPANDKFQIITEHAAEELNVADNYLGNAYSDNVVLIQITLNTDRRDEEGVLQKDRRRPPCSLERAARRRGHQPCRGRQGKLVVRRRHRAIRGVEEVAGRLRGK